MPQDRTRLWAGLAILAIAVPVAGIYLGRSTPSGAPPSSIQSYARPTVVGLERAPRDGAAIPVARTASRDYLAEVRSATVGGSDRTQEGDDWAALDDEMFDLSPFEGEESAPVATSREAPPEPSVLAQSDPGSSPADSSDGPVADEAPETDATGQPVLTDAAVYRMVVSNLNENDRSEFVRAYTAMTPAQRADLLDGFRAEMENDESR